MNRVESSNGHINLPNFKSAINSYKIPRMPHDRSFSDAATPDTLNRPVSKTNFGLNPGHSIVISRPCFILQHVQETVLECGQQRWGVPPRSFMDVALRVLAKDG